MSKFFVLDTNCLVSASILPKSLVRQALDKAISMGTIVSSEIIMEEYLKVLFREKFDKYFISNDERLLIFNLLLSRTVFFSPTETISICRDPKDNKFPELAVAANASCIITGDDDLLVLNPFREIPVITVADFLNMEF